MLHCSLKYLLIRCRSPSLRVLRSETRLTVYQASYTEVIRLCQGVPVEQLSIKMDKFSYEFEDFKLRHAWEFDFLVEYDTEVLENTLVWSGMQCGCRNLCG